MQREQAQGQIHRYQPEKSAGHRRHVHIRGAAALDGGHQMVLALTHQTHGHSNGHCRGYPMGQSIDVFRDHAAVNQRLAQRFEDLAAVVFIHSL